MRSGFGAQGRPCPDRYERAPQWFAQTALAACPKVHRGGSRVVWTADILPSLMTAKGTGLDLALRTVFDTLSTPELTRLSGIFADPAFNKFFTAIISSEIEDIRDRGMDNERTAIPRATRSVLEKHGLKVPQ